MPAKKKNQEKPPVGNPPQAQAGPSPAAASNPSPAANPRLHNSTRRIDKATYVPLIVPRDTTLDGTTSDGSAVPKFGYLQRLSLQPGEVDAVRSELIASGGVSEKTPELATRSSMWRLLRAFEGTPMPSQLPSPSVFGKIPSATLLKVGKAVVNLRQKTLDALKQKQQVGKVKPAAAPGPMSVESAIGFATVGVNSATTAIKGFEANVAATPIGMLNLERLEMTPAGIERGELLATIPLAPRERTAVVQKEWSVTTKEFTSIVTDSLENYSETGVTENTELAQSTKSQNEHSNQLSVNASIVGSYGGFVTATVATAFGSQDKNSASAEESRKHAVTTTRKASSRVKQEHKVTISTKTETGTSETTTRKLENPSDTNPMRIDYFSMMRKWHVGLYRYGLRMTYDLAIPEPGGAMRKIYADIAALKEHIGPFDFPLKFTDITREKWPGFASQYQVTLVEPPKATMELSVPSNYTIQDDAAHFFTIDLDLDEKYVVTGATLIASMAVGKDPATFTPALYVLHVGDLAPLDPLSFSHNFASDLDFLKGLSGKQYVMYRVDSSFSGILEVDIQLQLTDDEFVAWQQKAWTALYNAAQTQYYAQQQDILAQIAALQDKIDNVDTLTLRREENEEIMKGVLRWLLGPSFDFMPPNVYSLFADDLKHGVNFTGSFLLHQGAEVPIMFSPTDWSIMFQYEEMVKFINEAIEWENVLYFLYSYFWDVPQSWEFIRGIRHPDPTRQAFLRAGSARIVLPVRRGWEEAWIRFVEAGGFGQTLLPNHPYLSIAEEIKAYDQKNYPGIPPANPAGGSALNIDNSVAAASTATLAPSTTPITFAVDSTVGFTVGNRVLIDTFDSQVQESQVITAVPDGTHITVKRLDKAHDGTTKPFPVLQSGEYVDHSVGTACNAKVAASVDPVIIAVDSSLGFTVGNSVLIDTVDSEAQEWQVIKAIPDSTHITVEMLDNSHFGNERPFPVSQPGEKGVLISEWFEYTPSSGTDIAVTSNLATIS